MRINRQGGQEGGLGGGKQIVCQLSPNIEDKKTVNIFARRMGEYGTNGCLFAQTVQIVGVTLVLTLLMFLLYVT